MLATAAAAAVAAARGACLPVAWCRMVASATGRQGLAIPELDAGAIAAEALERMVVRSPTPTGGPASQETSGQEPGAGRHPLLIRGLCAEWPIRSLFNTEKGGGFVEAFRKLPGDEAESLLQHRVPVEASIRGGDYRDHFLPGSVVRSAASGPPAPGQERRFEAGVVVPLSHLLEHIDAVRRGQGGAGSPEQREREPLLLYLAQHDLVGDPGLAPILQRVHPPPFRSLIDRVDRVNVWLGPQGTVSPLHRDPYDNVLCQAVGVKSVALVGPAHAHAVRAYAESESRVLRNTSRLDVPDPRHMASQEPFANAEVLQGVLRAGDALYVPRGWFHVIRAETSSLSVSFWWT